MMKHKTMNRIAASLLAAVIMTISIPSFVLAIPTLPMNISIRIEGISANLYNQTIAIPYGGTLTVKGALEYLDSVSEDITIGGLSTGFINDINGDASGTFGGWDGWLYSVNSVEASVGIDAFVLKEGDSILLYYGDPYGAGMQFPQVDASNIGTGILRFTSQDTTFDASWNPIVTTNPVAGATVTWYYGSTSATYTTNANGEVTILAEQLTSGEHRVQIEKYGANASSGKYLPLVLRLSTTASVTVPVASSSNTSSSQQTGSDNAQTGDNSLALPVLFLVLSFSAIVILLAARRRQAAK